MCRVLFLSVWNSNSLSPPSETLLEAVLRGEGFTVSSWFLQKVRECFAQLTCLRPNVSFPSVMRCVWVVVCSDVSKLVILS